MVEQELEESENKDKEGESIETEVNSVREKMNKLLLKGGGYGIFKSRDFFAPHILYTLKSPEESDGEVRFLIRIF